MKRYIHPSHAPLCCQKKWQLVSGVTLIELIVTVSIMAILLTLGLPSMRSFIVSNRLTSQANTLVSALNLARSESIKRNIQVAIIANTSCNWSNGWSVFADTNSDGFYTDDEELQRYTAIGGMTINSTNNFKDKIIYRPDGRITNFVGDHIDVCAAISDTGYRRVVVTGTGRVRVESHISVVCPSSCQ